MMKPGTLLHCLDKERIHLWKIDRTKNNKLVLTRKESKKGLGICYEEFKQNSKLEKTQ